MASQADDSSSEEQDLFPPLEEREFNDDNSGLNRNAKAAIYEKDSDEEELERLVLGNKASFLEQLLRGDDLLGLEGSGQSNELVGPSTGLGLEDAEDGDLFMIDVPGAPTSTGTQLAKQSKPSQSGGGAQVAAWEDSDDERLTISLANVSRLRKLRISETEDVVTGTEYTRRLRQQYNRLNPIPAWAREAEERPVKRRRRSSAASDSVSSDGEEGDSEVSALPLDKFLRDVNQLSMAGSSKRRRLRPEVIDIQRTREIPDKHKAPVGSLWFHPKHPVLLSSSTASVIYLHHIDPTAHPTPNPLLTSVRVNQVDIRHSEFLLPTGSKIFFAGRRRYFHSWDLDTGLVQKVTKVQGHQLEHKTMEKFRLSPCGRYVAIVASSRKGGGIVNILSVATMQWIAAARLDSRNGIADLAWWSTGDGLTILGKDGSIGEWSMAAERFLAVWQDEGSVGAIVMALGGHQGPAALGEDRWIAVGSRTGIMNLYDRNELIASATADEVILKERPEPTRRFEQLVTPITTLAFSPDGQLLAFSSQKTKDALRLVHLPSCTVYRNWPTDQTPLGRISSVAFGSQSDMLAVGNDVGKVRLWEIRS